MISDIGLGRPADRAKDILGRVYEYFLSQFASAEGKKGGQFYTPSRVVRVLVEMLAPYKGRVYDPCCGSGGMFVQSEKFIEAHRGKIGDISIYGQESMRRQPFETAKPLEYLPLLFGKPSRIMPSISLKIKNGFA